MLEQELEVIIKGPGTPKKIGDFGISECPDIDGNESFMYGLEASLDNVARQRDASKA
jgi:hypothetical protein